ncbi:hypothetical protein IWQ60_001931 [Tieghemiomyces parasiticus]|uniref:Uncharacterized protein n=1 Tax=Tieghemiomyces parasiticus TaxID=78921 RepID=A0A9W8AIY0_9FUNG|nr:hypothetical protein IWQ60_001931 [Tieghemiomyces parasiticus]
MASRGTPHPLTASEIATINTVTLVLGIVSSICSLLIALTYPVAHKLGVPHANRTLLHLLTFQSLFDIIFTLMPTIQGHIFAKGGCSVVFALYLSAMLYSISLQALIGCIAVYTFVLKRQYRDRWGRYAVVALGLLCVVLMVIPLSAGRFGYQPYYHFCAYVPEFSHSTLVWAWATYLAWAILGWLVSTLCGLAVIVQLLRKRLEINHLMGVDHRSEFTSVAHAYHQQRERNARTVYHAALRVAIYCLIPIGTILTPVWNFPVAFYLRPDSFTFRLLTPILVQLHGILNFLVFITEPVVRHTGRALRLKIVARSQSDFITYRRHCTLRLPCCTCIVPLPGLYRTGAAFLPVVIRKGPWRRTLDRWVLRVLRSPLTPHLPSPDFPSARPIGVPAPTSSGGSSPSPLPSSGSSHNAPASLTATAKSITLYPAGLGQEQPHF